MNVNFKTHFPWPGADGKPEETGFLEKIVAGLTRRHGDTELAPKLHTIRRVQTKPRFRAGMKLVLTTGGRFAPKPFCETECVSVQKVEMGLSMLGAAACVDIAIDGFPLLHDEHDQLARNDGMTTWHFTKWFLLDVITNGPEGDAYRVRGFGKYLVLCKRLMTAKQTDRDLENGVTTVASREVWTDSMKGVRELVDPERYPKPVCRCVKCREKKASKEKASR